MDHVVVFQVHGAVQAEQSLRVFEEPHDPGDGGGGRCRQFREHFAKRAAIVVEAGKPFPPVGRAGVAGLGLAFGQGECREGVEPREHALGVGAVGREYRLAFAKPIELVGDNLAHGADRLRRELPGGEEPVDALQDLFGGGLHIARPRSEEPHLQKPACGEGADGGVDDRRGFIVGHGVAGRVPRRSFLDRPHEHSHRHIALFGVAVARGHGVDGERDAGERLKRGGSGSLEARARSGKEFDRAAGIPDRDGEAQARGLRSRRRGRPADLDPPHADKPPSLVVSSHGRTPKAVFSP